MAHVSVHRDEIELDEPTLIEGLPGLGLVGKIAADHLVEALDMVHYASCHCEGLPEVAVYGDDGYGVQSPVRIHADPERDLLVLQSDVPVSPSGAEEFAGCVSGWFAEQDALPVFISGTQRREEGRTMLFGIATGEAERHLTEQEIEPPGERGVVSGPTGSLLYEAERQDLDSVGLIVESSAQFPDPAAAKTLLDDAIAPIAGIDVDTSMLVERAEEISAARERLAQRLQEGDDESSQAQPVGMFQ